MRYENVMLMIAMAALVAVAFLSFCKKCANATKFYRIVAILWTCIGICIIVPTLRLATYLVEGRYEFQYVYEHIDSHLPVYYRISALWAGQQGSLLLWASILAIGGVVALRYAKRYTSKILGTYSLITLFLVVLAFATNGFKQMVEVQTEGLGLAVALQDPWMVVHPPLVFIGYTGMGVLFSLVYVVINEKKLAKFWLRVSDLFLGLGILTGSVWAYRCLGWGGFWSWDAIENIALVPWLLMCAFLHGKKEYTKLTAIIPFTLAAFGTFLTRSGILNDSSVHAYTSSNASYAFYLLIALIIAVIVFCVLYGIKYRNKLHNIQWKNTMQVFRLATYCYSAIVFIATICPIITGRITPIVFYTGISIAYLFVMMILLVLYKGWFTKGILITSLLISFGITVAAIVVFPNINTITLLIFWICVIPLVGYCYLFICTRNKLYIASHIMLILFVIGIVGASGFTNKYMKQQEESSQVISIKGKSLNTEQIQTGKTTIVSTWISDYIVTGVENSQVETNQVLVFYESKPLIYLYWIGGFGMLAAMGIYIVSKSKSNYKGQM